MTNSEQVPPQLMRLHVPEETSITCPNSPPYDESYDENTASEPSTVVISNEDLQEKDANTRSTLKETDKAKVNCLTRTWHSWCNIYAKYSFLILIVLAVALAKAYPPLGAVYVQPQITATWIAVIFIFSLSGLGIRTEEFKQALKMVAFNAYVQIFNFFVVSGIVYGIAKGLLKVGGLSVELADGLIICACLPTSVSLVMTLTVSSHGDEAAAVFHSAFGNVIGVFMTPVLVLWYLGAQGDVDMLTVVWKLIVRVCVPIFVGQIIRNFCPPVKPFLTRHRRTFAKLSEWALVFIVYTVFCKTFIADRDTSIDQIMIMVGVVFGCLVLIMILCWALLLLLFRDKPKLQAMGLFGCTHKTIALGVPLIGSIYEGNPSVGLYTLPLLVWYPMQLFVGSLITPQVAAYVDRQEAIIAEKAKQKVVAEAGSAVEP